MQTEIFWRIPTLESKSGTKALRWTRFPNTTCSQHQNGDLLTVLLILYGYIILYIYVLNFFLYVGWKFPKFPSVWVNVLDLRRDCIINMLDAKFITSWILQSAQKSQLCLPSVWKRTPVQNRTGRTALLAVTTVKLRYVETSGKANGFKARPGGWESRFGGLYPATAHFINTETCVWLI